MSEYETLDSGAREEYPSGMRRDTQEGKPRYNLIDKVFLERWADLMTRGAEKYGVDNWRNADSVDEWLRFRESGERHHQKYLAGEDDEDHAAAVAFNLAAAEFVKWRLEQKGWILTWEYKQPVWKEPDPSSEAWWKDLPMTFQFEPVTEKFWDDFYQPSIWDSPPSIVPPVNITVATPDQRIFFPHVSAAAPSPADTYPEEERPEECMCWGKCECGKYPDEEEEDDYEPWHDGCSICGTADLGDDD